MSILELIAVLFSFLCVLLSVRKHVASWPLGLVGVGAYFVLFYQEKLYADMGLQVLFFLQGIYGWFLWSKAKRGVGVQADSQAKQFGISRMSKGGWFVLGLVILCSTMGLGVFLERGTDAVFPYLDSFLATTSLVANLLLARKVLESWVLWIGVDVLYVGLFFSRGLYLSSVLYVLFFSLALVGYYRWMNEIRPRNATLALS